MSAFAVALPVAASSDASPSNGSLLVPGDVAPGNYWAVPTGPDGGYVEVCSNYTCDVGSGMIDNYIVIGRTMVVVPYQAQMVNVQYVSLTPANVGSAGTVPPANAPPSATFPSAPDEQRFLRSANTLPMYVRHERYGGDAGLLAQGYRACEALDRYPDDTEQAARVLYPSGNTVDGEITTDGDLFMLYSATFLCARHAHLYENY